MSHEIAKLLLEHADTFLKRREAIATALSLGMPLSDIEAYLDWLDTILHPAQGNQGRKPNDKGPDPSHPIF